MSTTIAPATENLNKLTAFRQAVYSDLGPARDALFELADAVLLMPHAQSLAELSESPVFRRRWPSVYEALQDSRVYNGALLRHYVSHVQPTWHGRVVLCDAEYGNVVFVKQTAHIACDKLVRLRSNLCLRTAPPPYRGHGRPAVHGRKFKFRDARTWGIPTQTLHVSDAELGQVTIRRWDNLHFQKAAGHPLTVIRIECDAPHLRRDRRVIWLAWLGSDPPPIVQWWRLYFRRFAGDHWYRFAKQSLLWTRPRLKTPEQAERWSALMPLLTWQLWLARPIVCDKPRPWQKRQMSQRMTPGRVRQSLPALFIQIGTPACAPKPRGKSPGWPTGRPRAKSPRLPIVRRC